MKLKTATVLAGGPGSGCHGENCGRPSSKDIQKLIDEKKKKMDGLRQNGTERMSKQGVKWALSVNREEMKRLKDWLKRTKAEEKVVQ